MSFQVKSKDKQVEENDLDEKQQFKIIEKFNNRQYLNEQNNNLLLLKHSNSFINSSNHENHYNYWLNLPRHHLNYVRCVEHQNYSFQNLVSLKKKIKRDKFHKKKLSKKKRKNRFTKPPPDGGWGWAVVFASFIINLIADGISFSFGMIYVELIKYFGQSKSKTAWVGSLFFSMPLLAGPIASALTDNYGCRVVTIASGLIASLGFLFSSLVGSLEFLYITFSISGIGLALSYVSSIVIVAHYFEKKRSLATGLAVCGTGIGTFLFPPLTNFLLEAYKWQGTLLINACLFLIIILCGFLMKDLDLTEPERVFDEDDKETLFNKKKTNENNFSKINEENNSILNDLSSSELGMLSNSFLEKSISNATSNVISNATSNVTSNVTANSTSNATASSFNETSSIDSSEISDTKSITSLNVKNGEYFRVLSEQNQEKKYFNKHLQFTSNCHSIKSNSTLDLPTYLDQMHTSLKQKKLDLDHNVQISDQFHKDILLNLQKKSYFNLLIAIYPYFFPDCCRQCDICCLNNQITIQSESGYFLPKYDHNLSSAKNKNCKKTSSSSLYNLNINLNEIIPSSNQDVIKNNKDKNNLTKEKARHQNKYIQFKALPSKSIGQNLISSFVQLEPGSYFRHIKLKRESISYRSAMLNTPRYKLKASSCPDIYRNSLLTLHQDNHKSNLILSIKYFLLSIFDTNLLKDCRFTLFCISNSFLYACIDVPYIYMPEYAIQKLISDKMASYLISVIGIVNTLGIVIVGYIGDKKWIKTCNLYSLFTIIGGFAIFFLPTAEHYEGFVVLAAIYGFSISVNYTLISVILVDILTIEKFTTGYGFLLMVQGISSLIGPPIAGWLFDISGSYNITFFATGICIIFSGIIVLPVGKRNNCNWFLNKTNQLQRNNSKIICKNSSLNYNLNVKMDDCLTQNKHSLHNLSNV